MLPKKGGELYVKEAMMILIVVILCVCTYAAGLVTGKHNEGAEHVTKAKQLHDETSKMLDKLESAGNCTNSIWL